MSTTSGHESLWQLSQDVSIKNELRDFRNILDTLVKGGKITPKEKDEFTKEWLWTDPDKVDERANGLIDKFIQELINTAQERRLDNNSARSVVISYLDGCKALFSDSPTVRDGLKVEKNAPMSEVLRRATNELRVKVDEFKKDTAAAQITPAKSAPPLAREVKIPTPPVSAEPTKITPKPPAHAKPVEKQPVVVPEKTVIIPKVVPVIEPTAAKQPASAQKPASVEVQTITGKREIPPTNVTIQWVKESLQWNFADVNSPTKTEIIKVLNSFKDKTFDKKMETPESSAAAIFAIQAWLRLQWIDVIIDWVYWINTGTAIRQFQKKYNETATKKLIVDWIPWTNTINALLDQLK